MWVTLRIIWFHLLVVVSFRLAEQYKTSLASKEKIQKAIEQKKEYLASLQPGLQNIMQVNFTNQTLNLLVQQSLPNLKFLSLSQASVPVQEYLSMPFERVQKQAEVARHLPPPLYVLLVQASAYGQACGKTRPLALLTAHLNEFSNDIT